MEGIKGRFIGDVHDAVLLSKLLPNPTGEEMKFVDISTAVYSDDGQITGGLATHLSWEWAKEVEKSIIEPIKNVKRIKSNIRNEEIVVRLGGDEFLVILFTALDSYKSDVETISNRIIKDINKDILLDGNTVNVGCSIGASVWPVDTENISEAIIFADTALYESKRLNKNRLTFYMDLEKENREGEF